MPSLRKRKRLHDSDESPASPAGEAPPDELLDDSPVPEHASKRSRLMSLAVAVTPTLLRNGLSRLGSMLPTALWSGSPRAEAAHNSSNTRHSRSNQGRVSDEDDGADDDDMNRGRSPKRNSSTADSSIEFTTQQPARPRRPHVNGVQADLKNKFAQAAADSLPLATQMAAPPSPSEAAPPSPSRISIQSSTVFTKPKTRSAKPHRRSSRARDYASKRQREMSQQRYRELVSNCIRNSGGHDSSAVVSAAVPTAPSLANVSASASMFGSPAFRTPAVVSPTMASSRTNQQQFASYIAASFSQSMRSKQTKKAELPPRTPIKPFQPTAGPKFSAELPAFGTAAKPLIIEDEEVEEPPVTHETWIAVQLARRSLRDLELQREIDRAEAHLKALAEVNRSLGIKPKPKGPSYDTPLPAEATKLIDDALGPGSRDEVMCEHFFVEITRGDLATLKGLNWLNDQIMNMYMNILNQRSETDKSLPRAWGFNTHFYTKYRNGGYSGVRRWTKKVKPNIFALDLLLIPLHLDVHWAMGIVDFKNKTIEYYDSMTSNNTPFFTTIRKYLQEESKEKCGEQIDLSGWKDKVMTCPQQANTSDCGVFALKFADHRAKNLPMSFSQANMPAIRRRMVWEILHGKQMEGV
eukprot:m.127747 g.127747  ORF g.127747 m.127747 type:complete len:636 (+) comp9732_c0_seq3:2-1909(+)